jgi:hypothetical protein
MIQILTPTGVGGTATERTQHDFCGQKSKVAAILLKHKLRFWGSGGTGQGQNGVWVVMACTSPSAAPPPLAPPRSAAIFANGFLN